MLVTIYCDASFKEGVGAGAAWIKSERGTLKIRSSFSSEDPTHAETQIAYLAMKHALETWDNVTVLFINTDSLHLCQYMWDFHRLEPKSEHLKKGVKYIQDICDYYQVEHRFKHVKGHQNPNKGVRAWLNNWCDEQAKKTRTLKQIEDDKRATRKQSQTA